MDGRSQLKDMQWNIVVCLLLQICTCAHNWILMLILFSLDLVECLANVSILDH